MRGVSVGKEKRRRKLISAQKAFRRGLAIGDIKCASVAAAAAATVAVVQAARMAKHNPSEAAGIISEATEQVIKIKNENIGAGDLIKRLRERGLSV